MARNRRTKYRVRIRKFLNRDPQYPAFIIGIVEDTSGIPDDDKDQAWNWGDIELELGLPDGHTPRADEQSAQDQSDGGSC